VAKTKDDEYKIAIHEAGHAVMFFLCQQSVESITIVPNKERGYVGCCSLTNSIRNITLGERIQARDATVTEFKNLTRSRMAGEVAEELVSGRCEYSWSDLREALSALESAGMFYFLEDSPPEERFAHEELDARVDKWFSDIVEETKVIMKPHINAIKAIADKLMQRKTISGRLAKEIFKKHLPQEMNT